MRIIDYIRKLLFAKPSGLIPAHGPDPANAIGVKAVWLAAEDNAFGVWIIRNHGFNHQPDVKARSLPGAWNGPGAGAPGI